MKAAEVIRGMEAGNGTPLVHLAQLLLFKQEHAGALLAVDRALSAQKDDLSVEDLRSTIMEKEPLLFLVNELMLVPYCTKADVEREENWIRQLSLHAPEDRRIEFIYALSWICSDDSLSLKRATFLLRTVEDLALSRRVSNLASLGAYSRVVRQENNHVLTMKGVEHALRANYPEEKIFCLSEASNFSSERVLSAVKWKKRAWVVLGYGRNLHKTLLLLTEKEGGMGCAIFDSIGVSPSSGRFQGSSYVRSIASLVYQLEESSGQSVDIEAISEPRQKASMNCGTFVLFDMCVAMKLLLNSLPLFNDGSPAEEFFAISQKTSGLTKEEYDPQVHVEVDWERKKVKNIMAIKIAADVLRALLIGDSVTFAPEGYGPEGESEEDREEGCVIA